MRYRLLDLRDEKGLIPADGLERARLHVRRLKEEQIVNPADGRVAGLVADLPLAQAAGIEPNLWTSIGPGNIGGRIRSILIHPTSTNTMWAGSVGGGIWRTTNGGTTWAPVNDFMANLAVATLIMNPLDTNVLYAGTGEGFFNADAVRGAGVFKSTNGGVTWTQLPSTATSNFFFVNRLAISPDGATLLAATNTGIWRSTNAGTSWTQATTLRTLDVDFNPSNSAQAIAGQANGVVLFSTNGGAAWTAAPSLGGMRVEVAYAPNAPTITYASVENTSGRLYRSTNGGQSYTLVNSGTNYLGGQGWYDNLLWVDPTNSAVVIVGGIDLWRSTNSGSTFSRISQWQSAPTSAHADHHVAIAHPGFNGTTNRTVFFGNDGGVYRASNVHTVSLTSGWQELNNNLGVTQFYGAAGNAATGTIVGGTQDNGTLRYTTGGGAEAHSTMFGGDGGFCASDPTNANVFYGEYVFLRIHRSTNGGASSSYIWNGNSDASSQCANFIAPFILDPNNANRLLGGGCSLWRSNNAKATTPAWAAIKAPGAATDRISAIAVRTGSPDTIWVGYNSGDVSMTTNGTATTPAWTAPLGAVVLPNRKVTRITVVNANTAYVTFGGFSPDNVWRTDNAGATWMDVTGSGATGLPDVPVRSLVFHPSEPQWIYVGTEVGVFASEDGGATWALPHDGPANVSVDELTWVGTRLVAATHGRGLFRVDVPAPPKAPMTASPAPQRE